MIRALRWPVVIVLSSALLSGLVLGGVHSPLRLLVTAWFLLVCTGMAFAPLFRIPALSTELAVGVAASIALDTVVATTIALIGGLSATSGLFVLEAICLAGCAMQARSWVRARELTA
jgi:hypothetical protein